MMGIRMDKTIINYLNYIGIVYFVEIVLFVLLWIYGSDFSVENNPSMGVLISIGMLTFVSIFFSFLYTTTGLQSMLHRIIDISANSMKSELIKQIRKDDNLKNIFKTTQDIESIKNLKNWVKPELWLYGSILLYLCSMVFTLVSSGLSDNAVSVSKYIGGVLFYAGLTCTFFLITSII